jgi:hypothetical protein
MTISALPVCGTAVMTKPVPVLKNASGQWPRFTKYDNTPGPLRSPSQVQSAA